MSKKSMPVLTPILSNTPMSASTGALPAPAPNRRTLPSICLAPARTASTELATPEAEVLMAVEAHLGVVAEFGDQGGDPVRHALEHQGARGIDDIDALAAGVGHDPGLLGQLLRRGVWLIIRKPTVSRPRSRAKPKCWMDTSASVQWVAIRQIDPPLPWASLMSSLVPTPGSIRKAILASFGGLGRELDQFLLRGLGEPVVERRATEAVAVGDLDDGHPAVSSAATIGWTSSLVN